MKKLSLFEQPLCIYCDQQSKVKELLIAYHDESHKYWKCKRCGLIFEAQFEKGFDLSKPVENLDEKDIEKFRRQFVEKIDISDEKYNLYPRFEYKDTNEMQKDIFFRVKDRIDRYVPKQDNLKILEVGCATGFLLEKLKNSYSCVDEIGVDPSPVSIDKAKRLGLNVVGIEVDSIMVDLAKKKGINIIEGFFEEQNFGENTFDLIFADNVIEHVFYPLKTLKKFNSIQNFGDKLILRLPETEHFGPRLKLIDHTFHFTRKSIEKILRMSGYKVEKIF